MSRMNSRVRKFFSYYRPYLGFFSADMACAVIASAAMLAIPLCVRYITANLLQVGSTDALHQIYIMGGLMNRGYGRKHIAWHLLSHFIKSV